MGHGWLRAGSAPHARRGGPLTCVFFVPHQDDEVLSMGAAIAADVRAGGQVHLVLLGDGTASTAREKISRRTGHCLTPEQMGAARTVEFRDCAARLGVEHAHTHVIGLPDGGFGTEEVTAVLRQSLDRFGTTARYAAMSWLDLHPDHSVCGRALDALAREERLDARFFLSPLYQPGPLCRKMNYAPAPAPPGGWIEDLSGRVLSAAAAYDHWDPAAGRFAIGERYSVPDQFAHLRRSPRSRWHRDSSAFAGADEAAAAAAWLERYAPQPAAI